MVIMGNGNSKKDTADKEREDADDCSVADDSDEGLRSSTSVKDHDDEDKHEGDENRHEVHLASHFEIGCSEDDLGSLCSERNKGGSERNPHQVTGGGNCSLQDSPNELSVVSDSARVKSEDENFAKENEENDVFVDSVKESLEQINAGRMFYDNSTTKNSAAIDGIGDKFEKFVTVNPGMETRDGIEEGDFGKPLERECDRKCLTLKAKLNSIPSSQGTAGALVQERAYSLSHGHKSAEKRKQSGSGNEDAIRVDADENVTGKNTDGGDKNPNRNNTDKNAKEDSVCGTIIGRSIGENTNVDVISDSSRDDNSGKNACESSTDKSMDGDLIMRNASKISSVKNTDEDRIVIQDSFAESVNKLTDEDFVGKDCDACVIFRNTDEDSSDRSIDEDITDNDLRELTSQLRKNFERMLSEGSSEDCDFAENQREAYMHREDQSISHESLTLSIAGSNLGKEVYGYVEQDSIECESETVNTTGSDSGKEVCAHGEDDTIGHESEAVSIAISDYGCAAPLCSIVSTSECPIKITNVCSKSERLFNESRKTTTIDISSNGVVNITDGLKLGTSMTQLNKDGHEVVPEKVGLEDSTTDIYSSPNVQLEKENVHNTQTREELCSPVNEMENKETMQDDVSDSTPCCKATSLMSCSSVNVSLPSELNVSNDGVTEASHTVGSTVSCVQLEIPPVTSTVDIAHDIHPLSASTLTIKLIEPSKSIDSKKGSDPVLSGRALVEHTKKAMDQILKSGLTDALLLQQSSSRADGNTEKALCSAPSMEAGGDAAIAHNIPVTDSRKESPSTSLLLTSKPSVMSLSGPSISRDPAFKFITTVLENNNAKVVSSSLDSTVIVISAKAGEGGEEMKKEGGKTEQGKRAREKKKQSKSIGNDLVVVTKKPVSQESTSLSQEKESVSQEDESVSLESESISLENKSISLEKEQALQGSASISMQKELISLESKSVPRGEEVVSTEHESILLENNSISLEKEQVPQENTSMLLQGESIPLKIKAISFENEPVSRKNVSTSLQSELISSENRSIPLEKEQASQDNSSISLQNELTPLEGKSVPQGDESVSLDSESISLENKPVSAEKEQVSQESASILLQNESVPFESKSISLGKEPVSQENVLASLQSESIPLEIKSILPEKEPRSQKEVSVPLQSTPMPLEKEAVSEKNVSVLMESTSMSLEKEKSSEKNTLVPVESTSISLDKETISEKNVSVPVDSTSISLDKETISEKNVSVPVESTSISLDKETITEKNVSVPVESTSMSLDKETISEKNVSVPVDSTSMSLDKEIISEKNVSVPVESTSISLDKETISKNNLPLTVENKSLPLENKSVPQKNASMSLESELMPVEDKSIPVEKERHTKECSKEIAKQDPPRSANTQSSKTAQNLSKPAQNFSTLLAAEQIYNSFVPIAKLPTLENFYTLGNIGTNPKRNPYVGKQNANDRVRNSGHKSSRKRKRDDSAHEEVAKKQLGTNIVCLPDNNLMVNYVMHPKSKSEVSIVSKNEGLLVKNSTKRETHRNFDVKRTRTLDSGSVDEAKIDWLEKQFLSENQSSQERIKRYCDALKRTLVAKKNLSEPITGKKDADGNMVQSLKTRSVKNLASIRPSETVNEVCSYKDVSTALESLAPDVQNVVSHRNDSGKTGPKEDGVVSETIANSKSAEKTGKIVSQVFRTQKLPKKSDATSSAGKTSDTKSKESLKTHLDASDTVATKTTVSAVSQEQNALASISTQTLADNSLGDVGISTVEKVATPGLLECPRTSAYTGTESTGLVTKTNLVMLQDPANIPQDKVQKEGDCFTSNANSSKGKQKERLVGASKRKPDKRNDVLKPCDVYGAVFPPLSPGLTCLPRPTNVLTVPTSNWPVLNHNGTILVPVQNYPTLDSRWAYANVIGTTTLPTKFVGKTTSTKDDTKSIAIGNATCNSRNIARSNMTFQDKKVIKNTNKRIVTCGTGTVRGMGYSKQNSNDFYRVSTGINYPLKSKSASRIENKGRTNSRKSPKKKDQSVNVTQGLKGEMSFQILKSVNESISESNVACQNGNKSSILPHNSTTGQKKEMLCHSRPSVESESQRKPIDNLGKLSGSRDDNLATNEQIKLKTKANEEVNVEKNADCATSTLTNQVNEALALRQEFKEANSEAESNSDSLAQQLAKHLFGAEKKPLLQSVFSKAKKEISSGILSEKPQSSGIDDGGHLESSNLRIVSEAGTKTLTKEISSSGAKMSVGCVDKSTSLNASPEVGHLDSKRQEDADVYTPKISAYLSPEELAKNRIDNKIFRVRKVSLLNDSSGNSDGSAKDCPAVFVLENPADVGSSRLCIRVPSSVNRKEAACLVKDLKDYISQQAVKGLMKSKAGAAVQGAKSQNMGPALRDSSTVCFKALVEYLRKPDVKAALERIIKQNRKKAISSDVKEPEISPDSNNSAESNVVVSGNSINNELTSSGKSTNSETVRLEENVQVANQSSSSTGNDILELEDVERALGCFENPGEAPSVLQETETDHVSAGKIEKFSNEVNSVFGDTLLAEETRSLQMERVSAEGVEEGGGTFKDRNLRGFSKVFDVMSRNRKRKLFDRKKDNDSSDLNPDKRKFICRKVTLRNVDSAMDHLPEEDIASPKDDENSHYLEAAVRSIVKKNLHLVSSASLVTKPAGPRNLLRPRRTTLRKSNTGISSEEKSNILMNQKTTTCFKTNRQFSKPSPISSLLWRNIRYNANLIGRKRTLLEPASTLFSWECLHMFNGRGLRHDRTTIIDKLQKYEVKMQRIRECYGYAQKRIYSREEVSKKGPHDDIDDRITENEETSPTSLRATASRCPVFPMPKDSSAEKRSAGDILNEKAKLLSHSFFAKRRSKLKWKDQTLNEDGELTSRSLRAGDKRGSSPIRQYVEDCEPCTTQVPRDLKDCTCSKVVNNIGGAVFESSIGNLARSITKHVKKGRLSNNDGKTCPKCKKVLQNAKELTRHVLYHLVDKAVDHSFEKGDFQGRIKRSVMKDLITSTHEESKLGNGKIECFDVIHGSASDCSELSDKFHAKETQIYKAQFWAKHQVPCTPTGGEDLQAGEHEEEMLPNKSQTVWTPLYFDVPVKPVKWQCLNCGKKCRSIRELKLHVDECSRNDPDDSSQSDSEIDVSDPDERT